MCGIEPERFGILTFVELDRLQWAYIKRETERNKDIVRSAWWVAHLAKYKNLPNLTVLLTPARALTGEELETRQREHEALLQSMGK